EGGVARYLKRPAIAHSEYLEYAAETGLPATLLMMALSGYLVWLAIRRTYTCPPETRAIQEAAALVSIGLAAHALVDNNWVVPVMAAGLVVFALADVLPYREQAIHLRWTPSRTPIVAIIVATLYVHSTLIPSAGLWFNELGYRASNARD